MLASYHYYYSTDGTPSAKIAHITQHYQRRYSKATVAARTAIPVAAIDGPQEGHSASKSWAMRGEASAASRAKTTL